jgi:hypothetical protein
LAGVGSLVLAWTFFDGVILGLPIFVVSMVTELPVIAFAVGAVGWILFNFGAGHWIEREWDTWIVGTRFETKLSGFAMASGPSASSGGSGTAHRSCMRSRAS